MGCGPSKPSKPSPDPPPPRTQFTRGAYAPCNSDGSGIHVPQLITTPPTLHVSSARDMSNYDGYVQQQRYNHGHHDPSTRLFHPQSEPLGRLEWTERNPVPARRATLGVNTGRRKAGQSLSNPNGMGFPSSALLSSPMPLQETETRSPSPVSSIGTTKWDRPECLKNGR